MLAPAASSTRTFPDPLQQVDPTHVRCGRRQLVYFGGCDYYRLSRHPEVVGALQEGLARYGLNVAASRVTTGNHVVYEKLETDLARFFGAESALLLPDGYAANLALAQGLAGRFATALIDQKAHPSLWNAARFLDCPMVPFKHRDPADLARVLKRVTPAGEPILLTDGMFSHSGAIAPVSRYLELLPRKALLLVDDAHAAGVLGEHGRGTAELEGAESSRIVQTITLSKAFGVFGGAVLGQADLREAIAKKSGVFAGSTPLPVPLAHAARQAVRVLANDRDFRQRLSHNTALAKGRLRAAGLELPDSPSPIIAVQPKRASDALAVKRRLLAGGIYPCFIRYPGGPPSGYFRFALSSEHLPSQIEKLAWVLGSCCGRLVSGVPTASDE